MKVFQLFEMAAKKLCPQCGKTMAANHYWYKGGWRCKKAKDGEVQQASATVAPTPTPAALAPTPKVQPNSAAPVAQSASLPPTKEELAKHIPELGMDELPRDALDWQIYEYNGKMNVTWEYTFRRNTRVGAYHDNKRRIMDANARIRQFAEKYPDYVVSARYVTPESAQRSDERVESNGDDAYSEYEQSLSGGITFAVK